MSGKSISEHGKETLKWIQREQRENGLGMVESTKVPDQNALRFLLRKSDVYEPQQGMIKSSVEPEDEESCISEFPDHKPWVWRTPKPKKKGDVPEPYEFLSYPDWNALSNAVAEALRTMGFADAPYLHDGYSYRKMAGGALRRKMIGTYSKEEMLAELKFKEDMTDEELAKFEANIDNVIGEYRGKSKQVSEVLCPGIVYYPKDSSFSVQEKPKKEN